MSHDFVEAMQGLERGLRVRAIMSAPLSDVGCDDEIEEFFQSHEDDGFDCCPVRNDKGAIVGMAYREDVDSKPRRGRGNRAVDVMRPLHEIPIISADASIVTLIREMRDRKEHYWLVIEESAIQGIVTRSDLARLPVRLLAMARIVHLEQLCAALIRAVYPDDSWLDRISEHRAQRIKQCAKCAEEANEQIDLLEYSTFADKVTVVKGVRGAPQSLKRLGHFNDLRNLLMHGRTAPDSALSVERFLRQLGDLDAAMDTIREYLRLREEQ